MAHIEHIWKCEKQSASWLQHAAHYPKFQKMGSFRHPRGWPLKRLRDPPKWLQGFFQCSIFTPVRRPEAGNFTVVPATSKTCRPCWQATFIPAMLSRMIYHCQWKLTQEDFIKEGKSEGFESCNRPIVRKRPIWVKIGDVLYRVTLKFDGWPWKTKGHLSFAVSSFVQHFIAIGEFKLELQSGNAQFG